MSDYYQPLLPNRYYHVFNRAVGNEKLFFIHQNYEYFLRRMKYYLLPVATLYAYSLMPNHFHLLVKIRRHDQLAEYFFNKKGRPFNPERDSLSFFVMQQFRNWLSGYAKAINKQNCRKGALFIDYLKRTSPETIEDLRVIVAYIHRNAIHHQLTDDYGRWVFDSYSQALFNQPGKFATVELLKWFGRATDYQQFHRQYQFLHRQEVP